MDKIIDISFDSFSSFIFSRHALKINYYLKNLT